MSFFGDIERLAADLYPYRWPIGIAALIFAAAVAVFAYRHGWHRVVARHKFASLVVAVVVLAILVPAGNYLLSPLWTRVELSEASPLDLTAVDSGAAVNTDSTSAVVSASPRIASTGEFYGADELHRGSGQVQLIETEPGGYTLRFENFSVLNGPDLYVYLSPSTDGYADGFLDLGRLRATDGAFNYDLPAGVDVAQYRSVIIWCKRFGVLFATAPLVTA